MNTVSYGMILILGAQNHLGILSVWGQLIFFSIFIVFVRFGMLLKGMGESFILSKDEPLTPNIDGVMAL